MKKDHDFKLFVSLKFYLQPTIYVVSLILLFYLVSGSWFCFSLEEEERVLFFEISSLSFYSISLELL